MPPPAVPYTPSKRPRGSNGWAVAERLQTRGESNARLLLAKQIEWLREFGGLSAAVGRTTDSSTRLYTWADKSTFATPYVADLEPRHVAATWAVPVRDGRLPRLGSLSRSNFRLRSATAGAHRIALLRRELVQFWMAAKARQASTRSTLVISAILVK
jgi:hypothetical protein